MRTFNTWRDPYNNGITPCRLKQIEIKEGLTVLVGCNGAGKTTLLKNIKESLDKDKIPNFLYNNLDNGRSYAMENALYENDTGLFSALYSASEGEAIGLNIGTVVSKIRRFLDTGKYVKSEKEESFSNIFRSMAKNKKDKDNKQELSNERWMLFDATDSGFSIDNIVELKQLFQLIIDDGKKKGKTVYIVISANEYELVSKEECFDVNACKYLTFKNYEDYKKFILQNAEKKRKRIQAAAKKRETKKSK